MRTRTLRGRPRFHLYPPRFASGWVPPVRHSTKGEYLGGGAHQQAVQPGRDHDYGDQKVDQVHGRP